MNRFWEEIKNTDKKVGLVLEGGAMRAMYSAGVLDVFMEHGIEFDGIIGVSAVLAVSRGVKDFIGNMQNDMLSSYPLEIAEESVDYTSLMTGLDENKAKEALKFDINTEVGVDSMINFLMTAYSDITSVKTNTINDELMDYIDNIDPQYAAAIYKNYGIDPTNNIFTDWNHCFADENDKDIVSLNGLTQSYIAELKTVKGFESYASYVNLFTGFMNQLPGDQNYILKQYDLVGQSKFPENKNEMVLVVNNDTTLTDLLLAEMGMYKHDDFINIAKYAIKKNEIADDDPNRKELINALDEKYGYTKVFKDTDLLGKKFYYFPQNELYVTDPADLGYKVADVEYSATVMLEYRVGTSIDFYSLTYDDSDKLTGTKLSMGLSGSNITPIEFVRDGEGNPTFGSADEYANNVLKGHWIMHDAANNKDYKLSFTGENHFVAEPNFTYDDVSVGSKILSMILPNTNDVRGANYNSFLDQDIITNLNQHHGEEMKIVGILRLKGDRSFGCLDRGLYYTKDFADAYIADAALTSNKATLTKAFKEHIDGYVDDEKQQGFNAYVKFKYLDHTDDVESDDPLINDTHGKITDGYASSLNGDMSSSFSDLFSAITGVNYLEQDTVHFRSVCGLKPIATKDGTDIKSIEYKQLPKRISIYPNDFDAKDVITEYLDKWNSDTKSITVFKGTANEKVLKANERDELSYTDTISIIIAVITTFIDAITIALVVFTSLSLVVSCFMIAVITYISVVERIKEIGIIRSLGGRKQNVASLFIMENLLTGLFSGGFGIGLTYILEIILNAVLKAKFNIVIANLTPLTALIMIGISILLSVLSGLIPSQSAAHKDPVVALRSNE